MARHIGTVMVAVIPVHLRILFLDPPKKRAGIQSRLVDGPLIWTMKVLSRTQVVTLPLRSTHAFIERDQTMGIDIVSL
ncbi:MAG: hypothetical protein A3I66_11570 [Burkholderiales bacterium RIFCSPLOWO2_02_FULL_57_36]|nr:MAG: hypothetical protein A3I66_11570 [Burkholderiales bacterium RIFCSPLOWO2_02_FULL_57_36]